MFNSPADSASATGAPREGLVASALTRHVDSWSVRVAFGGLSFTIAAVLLSASGCVNESRLDDSGTVSLCSEPVYDFDMTGDAQLVVSATRAPELRFRWPDGRTTGTAIPFGRMRAATLALSRDGQSLVSGHIDGSVFLWQRRGMKFEPRLIGTLPTQLTCSEMTPDGRTVIFGTRSGAVWRFDLTTGAVQRLFRHPESVRCIAITGNGNKVVSCGSDVRITDLATGDLLSVLKPPVSAVSAVAYSPQSRVFAFGSDNGTVVFYRARNGAPEGPMIGRPTRTGYTLIRRMIFDRQGRHLYSSEASNGCVTVWRVDSAQRVDKVDLHGMSHISQLRLSADGELYVSSHNGAIRSIKLQLNGSPYSKRDTLASSPAANNQPRDADGSE